MEKSGHGSLIRYHTGEIRLIWKILIAVVIYVAVAILLRFIPIFLITMFNASRGIDRQEALKAAKSLVFEHPTWSITIGIVNALMSFLLVWFLIIVFEKRDFAWKDVGLNWRRNSLLSLVLGTLLALLVYIAGAVVDHRVLGGSIPTFENFLVAVTVSAVVRNLAVWIPMGFSEEIFFRGYVQTRLVERQGAPFGILIGSIIFTLLHLLGRPLSPATIFSGVILWAAVGTLYHWSKSVYLVGMFHGIMNSLLNVLPSERSETAGLIVHILLLLLTVVIFLRMSQSSSVLSNQRDGIN
jgi:membrane protease YdiL (CAAX protease family)